MSGDRRRGFVDTNILIYAFDSSASTKHVAARELIRQLWQEKNGALSIQILQEFYVNVTGKIRHPLSPSAALEVVQDFSQWTLHAPTADDVEAAIRLHQAMRLSFWDAMVVRSAAQLGCSVLWSEDLSHGQELEGLRIVNPFAIA